MIYILIAVQVFVLWPLGTFLTAYWWKSQSYNNVLTLGKLKHSIVWGGFPIVGILTPIWLILENVVINYLDKKGINDNMEIWK